ncbi:MAG TPA: BON domain-containing protein [Gemmatimonadales bacterium]|nr:BON domain-containing protein [Gemmatimonadales bacterium]
MAEHFSERNRDEWNRGTDREQREWYQGRNREQQWGQQGGYYGGYGQGGFGQGGYGQGYGQGGGFREGGYGQGGSGQQGYGREGYRESGLGQQMGSGGYIQGWGQGAYGQGGYGQSGFGQGQEYGYGRGDYERGLGGRGFGYSSVTVGRFVGRGPKGYRRPDDRIQEEVNEELTRHPEIDASEIEVQVQNSEVTLTGKVEDRHQKRLAEDLAERCSGVTDVHNQLKVDKGFFAKLFGTDQEDRERDRDRERITSGGSERSTTSRPRSTTTSR